MGSTHGLDELVADVRSNPRLSERIAHKFKIKNTTGYSLNALVDYSDPFDIITHLMIGSEGTLGFITRAWMRLQDRPTFRASASVTFPGMGEAVAAVREELGEAAEESRLVAARPAATCRSA